MKHLKHIFTVLLLLLTLKTYAHEQNTLVVEMDDGGITHFLLSHKPRITFTNGLIKIVSEQYSMGFSRANI